MVDRINATNTALQGLLNAQSKLAKSAERVSKGDLDTKNLVDFKLDARNVEVQSKSLEAMLDIDRKILDILA